MHNIATAAAAAATREMEDRLLLAEGRAAAAERAAIEATRAADLASRRVHDLTCDLARASAEVGDSSGRHDAAMAMQQQVGNACSASVVTSSTCFLLHAVRTGNTLRAINQKLKSAETGSTFAPCRCTQLCPMLYDAV
jgi:hypothetical protein